MSQLNPLPVVQSIIDIRQERYSANTKAWEPLLERYETYLTTACSEGNDSSKQRHQSRGQLLARDRISLLLDPDSPFLELCPFAGHSLKDSSPNANMIGGIGIVSGRPCMIISHIPTVSAGAWNEFLVIKQNRLTEIATENHLPVIGLVQSAGVNLPYQFRVFHKGGQIFRDLAVRSALNIPSCAVVFGSSTAGGAYQPALSDYTIMVKDQAQVFLGGPPLVKMATGETVEAEALGGAKMHAETTGLADQIAVDEFDAIRKVREWILSLSPPSSQASPSTPSHSPPPPRYPSTDLLSLVDPDIRKPFPMSEVLLRLVDDSRLSPFKPTYGRNLITTFAHIHSHPVGIIANATPVIHSDEALKGSQFIRLCNQQSLPIIFLHNVTGFMVGPKAETSGIIKKGAQFVSAVSVSKVPHISLIMGASYGAGNYAMCGRSYKPRFLFSWPSGRCSVMGPEQLAGVMETIQGRSARNRGGGEEGEERRRREVKELRDRVEREGECYSTSAHVLDDGVIHPLDTREVLGMCLEVVKIPGVRGAEEHRALARM